MKKMLAVKITLIALLAIVALSFSVACGSKEAATQETSKEVLTEETTTTAAVESETTKEEAQPAGECPAATSVKVESTNGAYESREPISWDKIGTQSATISHSTNTTAVYIYIANFDTSEDLKDVSLSDGQAIIKFTVTVKGEGETVPVSVGKYNVKEWTDNYIEAGIRLSEGSTLQIAASSVSSGDFEITSVTDNEICGKFNIDENWTKMSGEFKVPVVSK